jgi:hypothetical protein
MSMRRGPNWLALSLTPVAGAGASGVGATLHVHGGMNSGAVIVMTVIVTIMAALATFASALAPRLPALCRERSHARVRQAAMEHKLSVEDAATLISGSLQPASDATAPPPAVIRHVKAAEPTGEAQNPEHP